MYAVTEMGDHTSEGCLGVTPPLYTQSVENCLYAALLGFQVRILWRGPLLFSRSVFPFRDFLFLNNVVSFVFSGNKDERDLGALLASKHLLVSSVAIFPSSELFYGHCLSVTDTEFSSLSWKYKSGLHARRTESKYILKISEAECVYW